MHSTSPKSGARKEIVIVSPVSEEKMGIRVSKVVFDALKKCAVHQGFNGRSTAARHAILRYLRDEGYLKEGEA